MGSGRWATGVAPPADDSVSNRYGSIADHIFGMITASITRMTPFDASISLDHLGAIDFHAIGSVDRLLPGDIL